jgi:gamma-glutamyltranspeptidase/glutathione hydrolase
VDAAVATALALGSVAPAFSGIGGGGFALIWLAREGRSVFVDYRERAPHAAREDMFQVDTSGNVVGRSNSEGYLAVATPGTIAGHSLLLERYGNVGLKEVLQPAIGYARRGIRVGKALASAWKQSTPKLKRFKTGRAILLNKGKPYRAGERIRLKELAESLDSISKRGPSEFYTGRIANSICKDMKANGGLLAPEDLAEFRPIEREPVHGTYKSFETISAPPPSCGGTILLQTLNILEQYHLREWGHNSTQALHLIAEAMMRSNRSTRQMVCDPDFSKINVHEMVSKQYAVNLASGLRTDTASQPDQPRSSTSHLVVIDGEHNVVSMTESVECYFGSGVVAGDTGIILNDTMHDFEPRVGHPNSVAPWKIPMSSMSPTILLKDGKPFMAVGAAGASRIISSTLQTILNVADFGMPLQEAVAAPRIHTQGNLIQAERGVPSNSVAALRKMGHVVETGKRDLSWRAGLYFGGVHSALLSPGGSLEGGPDSRRDGAAKRF